MLLPGTSPSISQAAQRFREKKMRIFRVRGEVVDLIAIGASSCLVQEFLRRRQRHATATRSSGARRRQAAMARSWCKLQKIRQKLDWKNS